MTDWNGFLALANELAARDDMASKRTAISRAYYCAYHIARQPLAADGVMVSEGGQGHHLVWSELQRKGRARAKIGDNGLKLHKLRIQADYANHISDLTHATTEAMSLAIVVLRLLTIELNKHSTQRVP